MNQLTLELLLTSPGAFGLTKATPVQRAICRAIDGMPLDELAEHPEVIEAFGGRQAIEALPHVLPKEFVILAAVRCAKSMIAGATALRATQIVEIGHLAPGEIPRCVVVSLTLDNATATFDHIRGTLQARPAMRKLLLYEPKAGSLLVKSRCGRPIEIAVVPLSRAGGSLVSRWLVGAIFDEAPRMIGQDDGVRNLTDARANAIGRLLPGGQMITIGSPWAPRGPIYEQVRECFGRPSERVVVVRGTGPMLNPSHWTPEACDKLKATDPQAYRTDVLGEFADPETSLISSLELDKVERRAPLILERQPRHHYVATMDPATRGNAWTLTIGTRDERGRTIVVFVKQWVGSKSAPLSPEATIAEIASILQSYGVDHASTDQYAADALRDLARRYGINLIERAWDAATKLERFEQLRLAVARGTIELPADPVLRSDLLSIAKRVTQSGVTIELPRTTDGRHADYAPALAMLVGEYCPLPDAVPVDEGQAMIDRMVAASQRSEQDRLEREYGLDDDSLADSLSEVA